MFSKDAAFHMYIAFIQISLMYAGQVLQDPGRNFCTTSTPPSPSMGRTCILIYLMWEFRVQSGGGNTNFWLEIQVKPDMHSCTFLYNYWALIFKKDFTVLEYSQQISQISSQLIPSSTIGNLNIFQEMTPFMSVHPLHKKHQSIMEEVGKKTRTSFCTTLTLTPVRAMTWVISILRLSSFC